MVAEQRFETVDGYSLVDIEGVGNVVGPIRSAKKVLQRTTTDLIRHATYACAVHQLNAVGGAAALNFDRASDGESPFAAFADELATWAEASHFVGSALIGLSAEEAGPSVHGSVGQSAETTAASAAACVPANAESIGVVTDGDEPALHVALVDRTLDTYDDLTAGLASGADVLFVRGKTACLQHEVLKDTNVKTVIGLQPLTTTPRGLAVAGRAGAIIIPDFISAGGPILASLGHSTDEITAMTTTAIERLNGAGIDTFVRACEVAEEHLRTMTDSLPFGRPLAA